MSSPYRTRSPACRPLPDFFCSLGDLVAGVLPSKTEQQQLFDLYMKHEGPIEAFWEQLQTEPAFSEKKTIAGLQRAFQLGARLRAEGHAVTSVAAGTGFSRRDDGGDLAARNLARHGGGLGGIGLALAEHLASAARANIVLLGRTPMPPESEWDRWLATRGADDGVSRRIRRLKAVRSLGSEVVLETADVADEARVREVVIRPRARRAITERRASRSARRSSRPPGTASAWRGSRS